MKLKTEHIIIICLVIPLIYCYFKRTELFEAFDTGVSASEDAVGADTVDQMDETEFELNLEKENEDIEEIYNHLAKTYDMKKIWNQFRNTLDGKRYSIPGYRFVYCSRYTSGVVDHYFTKRGRQNNAKCEPGKSYRIPGYIFTCKEIPVDPDCPDCPDCPDDKPKYKKYKSFDVEKLIDYKNNGWVFNKILYKNNNNSKNCDEKNVSRNSDDSGSFVCCNFDKSDKNLLCQGQWDNLISQLDVDDPSSNVLVLKTNVDGEQQENTSVNEDKTHYSTIEYQYDTKLRNGLFIVDIAKIPKNDLFVPKLSLKYIGNEKREIDILKAVCLDATTGECSMGSSMLVGNTNQCEKVMPNSSNIKCDDLGKCDVKIPKDNTNDEITYNGAFACEVINDNKIKLWYLSKENDTESYNNAVLEERPDPAKWKDVDPYVIYKNCGDESESTFTLSIGTEFNDRGTVLNEQNKPTTDDDVSWNIRGVRIFVHTNLNVS